MHDIQKPIHQAEAKPRGQKLSFEEYEDFCNLGNDSVRKLGMLSSEMYEAYLEEPTAVTIDINGKDIPLLLPMEYGLAMGYDEARSAKMLQEAGMESGWVFALPPHAIDESTLPAIAEALSAVEGGIFYSESVFDESLSEKLRHALTVAGKEFVEVPMLDEIAEEGNQQATLTLYGFDILLADTTVEPRRTNSRALMEYYKQKVAQGEHVENTQKGLKLAIGSELTDAEVDDLWDVYMDRFQWLGEKHPISMEDSKEDFISYLRTENTLCSIFYKDEKPVCFAYFLDTAEPFYWLNEDFLNDAETIKLQPGQTMLFFPGIVSKESGMGYSKPVIRLIADIIGETETSVRLLFENTNRSEAYIPYIVDGVVNGSELLTASDAELLDKTTFHLLKVA
jgi:hypothetical protein